MARGLTKAVRWFLLVESRKRSDAAATEIGVFLEPATGYTNLFREYAVLKNWYHKVSARAPNPSLCPGAQPLPIQYGEYCRVFSDPVPEGGAVHPLLTPGNARGTFQSNNDNPLESEVEAAVCCLCNFKAGGHTNLRAEH